MNKLFRSETIENNRQRMFGDVILIQPISFWVFTLSILLIVVVVTVFLVYGTFARRETVLGFLVPDKGVARLYSPYGGIVESKNVIDGQFVKKGDALLEISTSKSSFDDISINQQLIQTIISRKQALSNQMEDESLVFDSELKSLKVALQNINDEMYQLEQQLSVQKQQLDLARLQKDKYTMLKKKNLIVDAELTQKKNSYFSAKSNLDSIKRQNISKQGEKNNILKQIEQLPLKKKNTIQGLQSNLTQLNERHIELEGNESYAIKATIDGRVTSIQVHPGQSVTQQKSLLTIIPDDTVLYAELFLPSRAIGFINVGQQVLFRYDAFPYQRFGLYEGTVEQVAQAVINADEAGIPLPSQEPVYRVKVSLNSQFVETYGKSLSLQAGMSVSADIILEERSLGEWLFAPIYSLRGKL
ncbi:MAG: HlyD family efflux transporter periplasmic adaptor subunit [Proteobacteria bacterium]|nr:HlyD family efflux transporter periplasmic adaptor subunit [Pseudomonadota bacterium]